MNNEQRSADGPASKMRISITFPQGEIGTDPCVFQDFAQAAEDLGFTDLVIYDHVLGADLSKRPGQQMPYDLDSMFHEPMVLMGYLAGATKRIRLSTGVIVLPQRQVTLFAKQAATLDLIAAGRTRMMVGVGWNAVEYEGLGVPFNQRGKRIDDQVPLLRRLWTERSLSAAGPDYNIVDAGIWPLPVQQPIPLWIGGASDAAMRRAARIGDGWFPNFIPPSRAAETITRFREELEAVGRDPAIVGVENLTLCCDYGSNQRRSMTDVVRAVEAWQEAGAHGVCIDTMRMGASGAEHITLMHQVADAVGLR